MYLHDKHGNSETTWPRLCVFMLGFLHQHALLAIGLCSKELKLVNDALESYINKGGLFSR